ncbi:UNVERIFIED_CONTAM: hypothetical protein FKN15_022571, partial [Acipenser sinensis]
ALPRHFIHGTCRLGQSCHFSHQPVWKSSQICKYFQKGCCWFGDRCRSCPQCRVKSTFYIPNKYWVSDPAQKHTLVAKFKERTRKPLVCLFPVAFKRNLLAFLHRTHATAPRDCLLDLVCSFQQDPKSDSWVQALLGVLNQDLESGDAAASIQLTSECQQRVKLLSEKIRAGSGPRGRWMGSFNAHSENYRKRKSDTVGLTQGSASDSEDGGSQSKKQKKSEPGSSEDLQVLNECDPAQVSIAALLKMILKTQSCIFKPFFKDVIVTAVRSWRADLPSLLQVELLCSVLRLSEVPEQVLPQFCTVLLALSPDLSCSTAAELARSLFLSKVLSLTEPASRFLMTAVTSFCSRYPRPSCCSLIGPILHAQFAGSVQMELVCRLIEDCLDPEHYVLVFG